MRRALVAIAFIFWPIAAVAAPPRVRLSYRAPEGCPGENAFVAAVAAQARPFDRAPRSAARVRLLDAEIARKAGGHAGVLRVREADGATSEREVRGATCDEVFSALALVAALTVDTGPPPPSPPPPDEPLPKAPAIARRWGVATTFHAGAFFSMAPDPAIGVSPAIEVSPPIGRGFDVRLGLVFAASPRADTAVGSAEFYWLAARIDATPFSFSRGWFSMGFTLGADGGAVLGRGIAVWLGREQWRPWFDVALGARVRATPLSNLGLELSGGMIVPITRETWVFERPDAIIHQTPPVGAYVTAGIRVVLRQ